MPTGNINVGDGGRVEVTGSTSEFDMFILGQSMHVTAHEAGKMTIGTGGTLDFLDGTGKVAFIDPSNGGTLNGAQELINYGLIKGGGPALDLESGGQIDFGDRGGTLVNLGEINPGHSPGMLTIDGDLVFDIPSGFLDHGGRLVIELGGSNPGIDYDVLHVTGNVDLTGGILELLLLPNFLPQDGDVFNFLQVDGLITGSFVSLVDHTGWGLTLDDLIFGEHGVSFSSRAPGSVPETASTALLFGIVALGLALVRRRCDLMIDRA